MKLRRLARLIWWICAAAPAVGGLFALFLAAEIVLPFPVAAPVGRLDAPGVTSAVPISVFVATNGVHTDLVLPIAALPREWQDFLPVPSVTRRLTPAPTFLAFGWGERHFYFDVPSWDALKIGDVFNAFFGSPGTVLHVEAWTDQVVRPSATMHRLELDDAAFAALVGFVKATFAVDQDMRPERLRDGYGDDDAFFAANGVYAFNRTCNNWTTAGLRAAHIPTALWGGLETAVMLHLP